MVSFWKDDIALEKLLPAFPIRILTHQVLIVCKNSDIEVVLWDVHWRETSQPCSHQLELEMWIMRFWPRIVSSNASICSADFSRTVWTWDTPAVFETWEHTPRPTNGNSGVLKWLVQNFIGCFSMKIVQEISKSKTGCLLAMPWTVGYFGFSDGCEKVN